MDTWENIRLRCRRDGKPIKAVARELNHAPNTIRRYLRQDAPPKPVTIIRPKHLDAYQKHIDNLLRTTPKITAMRIGSWLKENVDHEFQIGERALRKYTAERRAILIPREAFIRASYAPADQAQFDFSPMTVRINGKELVVQLFVIRLSYSGCWYARASMRCDQPSLFAGLLQGYTAFGGLTRSAIFDNATTAVKRVLRGRNREENEAFTAFRGGLALEVDFAAPAKGNEKGGVEGMNGFIEDNFFRPIPTFASLEELNVALTAFARKDLERVHSVHREAIGARFEREKPALRAFPATLPRACVTRYARVNKFAEVVYETNRYSVPTRYAHRDAILEISEDRVRIVIGTEMIAEHPRGFGSREEFLDLRHYLDLLGRKHRAAASAAVLQDGRIPAVLRDLFTKYRASDPNSASKRWMQVLALLNDTSVDALSETVAHACARGTTDPAAIALLLRTRRESGSSTSAPLLNPNHLPPAAQIPAPVANLSRYATASLVECAS
jgi:transposase